MIGEIREEQAMSEHDEAAAAQPESSPGAGGSPLEGGTASQSVWRERAAFHLSIHSSTTGDGQSLWQTRAYHEESDTAMTWAGAPGDALIHWLLAVAELPAEADRSPQGEAQTPVPPAEAPPSAPPAVEAPLPAPPADDFTQIVGISAATQRRLHEAGIRTYGQLAASSVDELAALLKLQPERITKRGWLTRARALAKLAELPGTPGRARPQPEAEAVPPVRPAGPALHIEISFDESGAIYEQRLLREGETLVLPIERGANHLAQFFVEPSALLGAQGEPGGLSAVELELDELELEEVPGADAAGGPQLRARSTLRLAGIGAELLREPSGYLAYLLAYELETGTTRVLKSVAGQLDARVRAEPLELICALPEIGRYQTLLVTTLADWSTLSAISGPRLRVKP